VTGLIEQHSRQDGAEEKADEGQPGRTRRTRIPAIDLRRTMHISSLDPFGGRV